MTMRTHSVKIWDLKAGDVVIPHTAEYQEWPVVSITRQGVQRIQYKIVWANGEKTWHGSRASFRVKGR